MDETLRKKILYTVCAGIIVLFGVIAVLLLMRKPQNKTIITRTEYLQAKPTPEQATTNLNAFLPPLSGTTSGIPLAQVSDTGGTQNSDTSSSSSTPPTMPTTTTTTSVSKAWSFFRQSIGLPFVLVSSLVPGLGSCGGANQPVCSTSLNNVTYITNQTNITNLTVIQQIVDIPLAILDSLQDIVFYKFVTLLQQSVLVNDKYPVQRTPEDTGWFTQLITTGEMSQFYYDVFKATSAQASACGTIQQTGFCYESNGTSANLYVRVKAATQQCPKGAIKVWNSDKNALQVTCF